MQDRDPDRVTETPKPDHGRHEKRSIWVLDQQNAYVEFPAVGQVFAVKREIHDVASGNAAARSPMASPASPTPPPSVSSNSIATTGVSRPRTTSSTGASTRIAAAFAVATDLKSSLPLRHRDHQDPRSACRRIHAFAQPQAKTGPRLPEAHRKHRAECRTLPPPPQPKPRLDATIDNRHRIHRKLERIHRDNAIEASIPSPLGGRCGLLSDLNWGLGAWYPGRSLLRRLQEGRPLPCLR